MAYQTGVASSISGLMTALFNFAESNGFSRGPSWGDEVIPRWTLTKGGAYFTFQFHNWDETLFINTATSLSEVDSGRTNIIVQLGAAPYNLIISPIKGPYASHHFFSDGSCIHVVVELVTNVFQHFSFGNIQKAGVWVGGEYVTGNNWSPSIRNSSDPRLWDWNDYRHSRLFEGQGGWGGVGSQSHIRANFNGYATATFSNTTTGVSNQSAIALCSPWNWGYELIEDSPNSFNSRSALIPVEILLSSQGYNLSPQHWLQLGHIPTAAAVNIKNLNPKEMVNNDWMVFPLCQKNGPGTAYVNTGNIGMAYRK